MANIVENKHVRIPLALFRNKAVLEKFPKQVVARAIKIGEDVHGAGRIWGPNISVNQTEAKGMFDLMDSIYRTKTEDNKAVISPAYYFRRLLADTFGFEIQNTRPRKPKEVLAAAIPPVAPFNPEKAVRSLDLLIRVLNDNGQPGMAEMAMDVKRELGVEDAQIPELAD